MANKPSGGITTHFVLGIYYGSCFDPKAWYIIHVTNDNSKNDKLWEKSINNNTNNTDDDDILKTNSITWDTTNKIKLK